MTLDWRRFTSFMAAADAIGASPCVYVQADRHGHPKRVGLAKNGLHKRYWGGTGWAVEAAAHGSGNLWFVALVDGPSCEAVERTLIWQWRAGVVYNQIGKHVPPNLILSLCHEGEVPDLSQIRDSR